MIFQPNYNKYEQLLTPNAYRRQGIVVSVG